MYDVPMPAKLAPELTPEERAAMQPVDRLVQLIIPRLIDKMNLLEWKVGKLEWELESVDVPGLRTFVRDAVDVISQAAPAEPKPKRTRRKKEAPATEPTVAPVGGAVPQGVISAPVATSSYANYDPDLDEWVPKKVDGRDMTGSLVDVVLHMGPAAEQMYPEDVITFCRSLSPDAVAALKARFPH